MNSIITTNEQINMAQSIVNEWVGNANTYLGIGRVTAWDNNIIPQANNSTDALNDVWNRLFALVKLTAANFQLVIPRVDWVTGTVYDAYDNTTDMFTYSDYDAANGVVTTNTSNNVIVGTNTTFTLDFNPGNYIAYANTSNNSYEIKEVVSVNSNTSITVNSKPITHTHTLNSTTSSMLETHMIRSISAYLTIIGQCQPKCLKSI